MDWGKESCIAEGETNSRKGNTGEFKSVLEKLWRATEFPKQAIIYTVMPNNKSSGALKAFITFQRFCGNCRSSDTSSSPVFSLEVVKSHCIFAVHLLYPVFMEEHEVPCHGLSLTKSEKRGHMIIEVFLHWMFVFGLLYFIIVTWSSPCFEKLVLMFLWHASKT